MLTCEEIRRKAEELQNRLIEIRRHLHRNPEVAFNEVKTGEYVYEQIKSLNLEVRKNVGGTGVVALLRGREPGKTAAIRADMDALPLQDKKDVTYASLNDGVCHACGHDAHMAMLIGTAHLLSEKREEFAGQVKFIFQPAEEKPPGGARLMVREGVLDNPPVDCLLGIHSFPYLPAGTVGIKKGELMAAADTFKLTILGRGGHGASPHQAVDAVVISSQVIQSLQLISSRMVDPTESLVISIGTIRGGQGYNIIAEKVEMEGTVRTLTPGLRSEMKNIIENVVKGVTSAFYAGYELEYNNNYPVLVNDDRIINTVQEASLEMLGEQGVNIMKKPMMGSEDFACYLERVPGAFFFLGTQPEKREEIYPWHHPKFDINEKALAVGTGILSWTVLKLLSK
ncbi:MAG: amidohydrolase [Firmicutes bacterium HGW-Firmicutes-13]|nr:MAG: amidohydrolase [Firmicutes bacterium HGW-Firmicutes-13]